MKILLTPPLMVLKYYGLHTRSVLSTETIKIYRWND